LAYQSNLCVSIIYSLYENFPNYTSPTLLNALAGFLTTIISLYTAHDGDWSIMVLLTVITSGLSVACSLILLYIYKFGKLERLKQEHNLMFRNEQPLHV
jgi:uncharacterized membrane protein